VGYERKVLVISKHSLFREGLRRVLTENPNFELLEAASSVEQAIKLSDKIHPDVIIFDGETGREHGSKLAQLFQLSPDRVVTLSMADSKMTVFSRRQVQKATVEDLIDSIQRSER
jgi:DNA-binding NarL/FixJ family response regulator